LHRFLLFEHSLAIGSACATGTGVPERPPRHESGIKSNSTTLRPEIYYGVGVRRSAIVRDRLRRSGTV
jgi:hypothetical protein